MSVRPGWPLDPARLPRLLVLTDRKACERAGRSLAATVTAAVEAGAPAVVLREKDLAPDERRQLGEQMAAIVAAAGARLVVASDVALAADLNAWGVHLSRSDPQVDGSEPAWRWGPAVFGRSCHDEAEIAAAAGERLDWVTLSPVDLTSSKPGYGPALGTEGLAQLAALSDCPPVFALGGIDGPRVAGCLVAGAHGVAVMGAVMGSTDPARATAEVLSAIERVVGPAAGGSHDRAGGVLRGGL